jgi:hypothetical protein
MWEETQAIRTTHGAKIANRRERGIFFRRSQKLK